MWKWIPWFYNVGYDGKILVTQIPGSQAVTVSKLVGGLHCRAIPPLSLSYVTYVFLCVNIGAYLIYHWILTVNVSLCRAIESQSTLRFDDVKDALDP